MALVCLFPELFIFSFKKALNNAQKAILYRVILTDGHNKDIMSNHRIHSIAFACL